MISVDLTGDAIAIISAKVIDLRKKARLSQKQLGDKVGFDQSTISAIENKNEEKFSIAAVEKISKFFNDDLGFGFLDSETERYKPSFDELLSNKILEIVQEELDKRGYTDKKSKPVVFSEVNLTDQTDTRKNRIKNK